MQDFASVPRALKANMRYHYTADISNTVKQATQQLCSNGSKVHYSNTKGVLSSSSVKRRYPVLHLIDSFSIQDIVAFSITETENIVQGLKDDNTISISKKKKVKKAVSSQLLQPAAIS